MAYLTTSARDKEKTWEGAVWTPSPADRKTSRMDCDNRYWPRFEYSPGETKNVRVIESPKSSKGEKGSVETRTLAGTNPSRGTQKTLVSGPASAGVPKGALAPARVGRVIGPCELFWRGAPEAAGRTVPQRSSNRPERNVSQNCNRKDVEIRRPYNLRLVKLHASSRYPTCKEF